VTLVDRIIEDITGRAINTMHPEDINWWRATVGRVLQHVDQHTQCERWVDPKPAAVAEPSNPRG
jgi:hypothetical protein